MKQRQKNPGQGGYTIVEVLIAMAVLVIVSQGFMVFMKSATKQTVASRLKAEANEHAIQMLENIGVSAKRGADIVRQVLTFARGIQGERIEIQPGHLLRDLELIINDIFPKDIRLAVSIPGETWRRWFLMDG